MGLEQFELRLGFVSLLYTAALLTVMNYFFTMAHIRVFLEKGEPYGVLTPPVMAGLLWVLAIGIGYFFLPVLILKCFGKNLTDYGLRTRGLWKHLGIYGSIFGVMLPILFFMSARVAYQGQYPFVGEARDHWEIFWLWEAAYILQFFFIEFFFRGFLLYSLEEETSDWLAIAVMVLPYTFVHFSKPVSEAFGAMGAGLVLGLLSIRYRSWVGGAVLHAAVGFSMDLFVTLRYLHVL